ncbi:hypothetical protein M758_7G007000 [Ceratodon purpureus]|uniref:Uncharacterized protein n=1 Tax=Ceratodon purpureus TaxID=3225 RepID=A0A8T0H4Q5_CERPU|nr:hypothetical protein KC19_7G007300 [Ceratodon purpureus]KAG0609695.1 hypothetical protein M758_7G007000 [Ceratodon purpureus]
MWRCCLLYLGLILLSTYLRSSQIVATVRYICHLSCLELCCQN